MSKIAVTIDGRDLSPCARLLEALTKTGLLDKRCTYEDNGIRLILTIDSSSETDESKFQICKFKTTDLGY